MTKNFVSVVEKTKLKVKVKSYSFIVREAANCPKAKKRENKF